MCDFPGCWAWAAPKPSRGIVSNDATITPAGGNLDRQPSPNSSGRGLTVS